MNQSAQHADYLAEDLEATISERDDTREPPPAGYEEKMSRYSPPVHHAKALYQSARRVILRLPRHSARADGRSIPIDPSRRNILIDSRTSRPFKNNFIKSSKYTYWNFLPLQLVAQFSRLANFYFLCISILQIMPGFSTTGRFTLLAPLLTFVSLSIAKEGYEDLRRHRLDVEENRREVSVCCASELAGQGSGASDDYENGDTDWKTVQWQKLRVGDIVRLERNEPVPADLLLVSCESKSNNGTAYFETMALDGETNLKAKQPTSVMANMSIEPKSGTALQTAEVVAEDPSLDLNHFEGKVTVDGKNFTPLTINELVLRGSILRDTSSAIGMVVYSGEECKIRKNANKNPRIKAPRLQASLNRIVILMVAVVLLLAICLAVACFVSQDPVGKRSWYLSEAGVTYGKALASYVIMFNALIPLSLYISLEFVKVYQMDLMNSDVDMYHEESNTPFEARTSTINEELGQVGYVFSDKTGTLTENVMRFRKLSVGAQMWNHCPSVEQEVKAASQLEIQNSLLTSDGSVLKAAPSTADLSSYIRAHPNTTLARQGVMMIKSMAICHTCFPEHGAKQNEISYLASSPDELALVEAAKDMGYVAADRTSSTLTLKVACNDTDVQPVAEVYDILHVLEFSSDRRRMSVVVRFPDGRVGVICKGADSVILDRLRLADVVRKHAVEAEKEGSQLNVDDLGSVGTDDAISIRRCAEDINTFATEGLRTLLYGYRFLGDDEYRSWRSIYQDASTALANRQQKLDEAAELVERDLELGGATAIEDKLQHGVPETLDRLSRANIKLWMLTGDKRETAINIARSCNLIKQHSSVTILDETVGNLEQQLNTALEHIQSTPQTHSVLIIDGRTLTTIENNPTLHTTFLSLAITSTSTLCCRASPRQKATLIHSIRTHTHATTLAIGDGANDVPMLQEAHIGIGLTGKEGLQAARVSDYSLAQFRFLAKLLLVHGRWNYVRTAKFTLGMFWKEMLFYLTQALFQRWGAYTGTSLYEPWALTTFQGVWTPLAVVFLGVFEKDLRVETLLAVPELYALGQREEAFNFRVYGGWMVMAVAEAVVIFFVVKTLYAEAVFTQGQDLFAVGTLSYSICLVVINLKLQLVERHDISVTAVICIGIELGAWFLWNVLFAVFYTDNEGYFVRGGFTRMFGGNVLWWLTLVVAVAACLLLEVMVRAVRTRFFPTETEIFQQLEKDPEIRRRFEDSSSLAPASRFESMSTSMNT